MIGWIIFGVLALIISEVIFLMFGNENEWILSKAGTLLLGLFGSALFFLVPYSVAYRCETWVAAGAECVNHGTQVFYYLYGITIGIVLLFLINGWLIKKIRKPKKEKKK